MGEREQAMTKALSVALKMEKDGMAFYREASKKTENELGRKMFLSFVKDEKRHYDMIEALSHGLKIDTQLKETGPAERMKTVFEEAGQNMASRLGSQSGDVEALKFALEMENKGYEFYKRSAGTSGDADEKRLFEMLAKEESRHHEILQNALNYLEETGDWFLWEEGGPIEGG
ncbi:MAG: ferritin family protein [Deltaproteobacteria bacterium]|nr:ferritin family protein [Deltaproteobacteria bacterium]